MFKYDWFRNSIISSARVPDESTSPGRDLSHQKSREPVSRLGYPCWRLMRVHSYFVDFIGSFEFFQSTSPSQQRHLPRLNNFSAALPCHLTPQLPRAILTRDLEWGNFSLEAKRLLRYLPLDATLRRVLRQISREYLADSNDHGEFYKGDLLSWFNSHLHFWT